MSKQLSLSAAICTFAMTAFVLLATPNLTPPNETGTTNRIAVPAFEAVLPRP